MEPSLLPSLALFAHVARHRSFTKAAAELMVSRAALSQSLKTLEHRLDVRLLNRTTRDMSLTEEGQRLLETLLPALANIEHAVRNVGEDHDQPSGLLRINTSRLAAKILIEPYIAEFLQRYRKLRIELVMDDGLANIIADGCDAGIRLGESLAEYMVAVPISPMLEMVVAGSPEYFAQHSAPASPKDLAQHNCLSYRNVTSGAIYHWEFNSPDILDHTLRVEPRGTLTTNDDEGMIRAALQGLGLIQHVSIALHDYLEAGSLVRVLQPWSKPFPGYYLYVPTREYMTARVRAFLDFLIEKRDRSAI
ncbi:LysR family transcriptional regulator [Pseudomonas fluorescens]|uniref:LysR family transcriptional regulator n=1 Tax=Pseudomonas fluorescens TaxID=294 RepID=A0A7Z6MRL1_PSEFL|nr:LysR family transcriptional regulator [Pseudomonas fluorescens]RDS87719.1 LysR family transcriptional regulator [Pseudomonas fluorescens]